MEMSSTNIDEITAERNDRPARIPSAADVYAEAHDRWVSRARAPDTAPRGRRHQRAGSSTVDVGGAPSRTAQSACCCPTCVAVHCGDHALGRAWTLTLRAHLVCLAIESTLVCSRSLTSRA